MLAQRIASDAKRILRRRGVNFFDMRGELRIVEPPLIIDTRVPATSGTLSAPVGPLESQVSKEVAIGCLLTPDQRHGVRELARLLARGAQRSVRCHERPSLSRPPDLRGRTGASRSVPRAAERVAATPRTAGRPARPDTRSRSNSAWPRPRPRRHPQHHRLGAHRHARSGLVGHAHRGPR